MAKRYLRYSSLSMVLLFIAMIFFSGCETLKGAVSGFKQDWDNVTKWDKELQKTLW